MAEQSTVRTDPGGSLAVVFRAGMGRETVAIALSEPIPVLTRKERPCGEPIRCCDCNRAIHPLEVGQTGALGRYRCHEHTVRQPRGTGRLTKTIKTSVAKPPNPPKPERTAKAAPPKKEAIPLHEAVPVWADLPVRSTGVPRVTLRERLAARRAAERTQG